MTERAHLRRPGYPGRQRSNPARRLAQLGLAIAVVMGGLAACGDNDEQPTPPATGAPTVAATAPTGNGSPPTDTGLTVGVLADRIGAAWPDVSTYRAVTSTHADGAAANAGSPVAGASPSPVGAIVESIDEIVLPDRKRRIVRANGEVRFELIAIASRVYARGPDAPWLNATRPDPNGWTEINPATLNAGAADAQDYDSFIAPIAAPYSALSPEERGRNAILVGSTTEVGRSCLAYQIADTTNTGERIEIVLSLDSDDLPCSIETRAGGQATTTIFTYNLPITIEAPDVATPVSDGT